MNKNQNKKQIPSKALELLPWYTTGTLPLQDHQYIENILSEYPELHEVLNSEHEMISAIEKDRTILEQSCLKPTSDRLETILEQLPQKSEDTKITNKSKQGFIQNLPQLLFGNSSKIQYTAFASITTLAIALLFAFAAPLVEETTGEDTIYFPANILSEEANKNTTSLLIGLNVGLTDPHLLSILKENKAEITAIPGKNGIYRFSLSVRLGSEETKILLNKLTDNKKLFWFAGEEF